MSLRYNSRIIVGIALKEVYQIEVIDTTKTKYNEDTGKPYETPVKVLRSSFSGIKLPDSEMRNTNGLWRANQSIWGYIESQKELAIYSSNNRYEGDAQYLRDYGILGIEVCCSNEHEYGIVTLECLNLTIEQVKIPLSKLGYDGEVKIYSQLLIC